MKEKRQFAFIKSPTVVQRGDEYFLSFIAVVEGRYTKHGREEVAMEFEHPLRLVRATEGKQRD